MLTAAVCFQSFGSALWNIKGDPLVIGKVRTIFVSGMWKKKAEYCDQIASFFNGDVQDRQVLCPCRIIMLNELLLLESRF